jgi:hypothetical protein
MQRSLWHHTWPRRAPGRRQFEDIHELQSSYQVKAPLAIAFRAIFQLAAMDLLYSYEPWRLARCARKNCKHPFVRKDKRQVFCSPACSQSIRTGRYRKALQEKLE